jgi:hypothetical protein
MVIKVAIFRFFQECYLGFKRLYISASILKKCLMHTSKFTLDITAFNKLYLNKMASLVFLITISQRGGTVNRTDPSLRTKLEQRTARDSH